MQSGESSGFCFCLFEFVSERLTHAEVEDAALCCRHLGYKGSARYLYGNLPVVFLNCSSKMPFVISQISQICCVHWRL